MKPLFSFLISIVLVLALAATGLFAFRYEPPATDTNPIIACQRIKQNRKEKIRV